MAVFLFIGSAVLLYIKASHPPGPLLFATIYGCIAIGTEASTTTLVLNSNLFVTDIAITTAVLFPFPYYAVGTTPPPLEDARPDFQRSVKPSCFP